MKAIKNRGTKDSEGGTYQPGFKSSSGPQKGGVWTLLLSQASFFPINMALVNNPYHID